MFEFMAGKTRVVAWKTQGRVMAAAAIDTPGEAEIAAKVMREDGWTVEVKEARYRDGSSCEFWNLTAEKPLTKITGASHSESMRMGDELFSGECGQRIQKF